MMIGLLQLRHHVSDDIQDMREVDRHTDHYRRLYMKCSLHTYGSSGHLETMRKMWGLRTDFHKSQSQVHLAVWGWWLTSWYIQSKGRKVVYDSFLFRLIVWNLCGLEDSRNLCDWLHCLGHAFLKETQLRAWHSTDFSLPKRDRSQIYKL